MKFKIIKFHKVLIINNKINESLYQENLDFSQYETQYKILAIYYPHNYINKIKFNERKEPNFLFNRKEEINLT